MVGFPHFTPQVLEPFLVGKPMGCSLGGETPVVLGTGQEL